MNAAVAYLRVSTEGQLDGYGLDAQESTVRDYCEAHGYTLERIFREEGVSGTKSELEGRVALIHLADYVAANDIPIIVIPELSRLARDLMIQERILSEWQSKGWTVCSVKEPDLMGNDPTRKLLRQLIGAINEYDRSMIVARMKAGRIAKARGGGKAVGQTPYGYDSVEGQLKPNPDEAEVVRTIYALRDVPHGWSFQRIADHLNRQGVPTRGGGLWSKTTVYSICNNPVYRGTVRLRDGAMTTEAINETLRLVE